jgi:hypothetical protein
MSFTTRRLGKASITSGATLLFLLLTFGATGAFAQVETTSVTLNWTAPGDDGSSGTATAYDIRYSTSPITEQNWDQATQAEGEPTPQIAGSDETFTISDLLPNTTYYFALKTSDEVPNWSALSNVVAVTTLDTEAPAAIADLSGESP